MAASGAERDRLTAARLKFLLATPFDRAAWESGASPYLQLRIGNDPLCTGSGSALDALETFLGRIGGFGCRYCELWQRREAVYAETNVRFTDGSGRLGIIPCAIVARVIDGLLQDMRFHLDPSPIP